jgi:hypothetical protein
MVWIINDTSRGMVLCIVHRTPSGENHPVHRINIINSLVGLCYKHATSPGRGDGAFFNRFLIVIFIFAPVFAGGLGYKWLSAIPRVYALRTNVSRMGAFFY